MTKLKLNYIKFHILHIAFILLLPSALLSFDFFLEKIPGNYYKIIQNPMIVTENSNFSSKAFNDPLTDCSLYLDDYLYLNKINKKQLFQYLIWDSSSGTGVPYFARWTTRTLSLFSLPFYFLPFFYAIFGSIWLKIVIAGIGTYLLALTYNLLPTTSLLISVIFQTLGIFIFIPIHPTSDIIAISPYYLILLHLFSKGNTKLWLFLTFPIALMYLGGRIQPILIILLFSILYLLITNLLTIETYKQVIRKFLLLASGWVLGTGLTLIQILPFIEWTKFRSYGSLGDVYINSLSEILTFLIPVSTDTEKSNLILQKITTSPFLFLLLLIPLYISGRSILKSEAKKYIEIFWVLTIIIFILVFILSSKLLLSIKFVEFLSISIADCGWLLILSTTLLIGLGLESWNLFNPDECRTCTKKLIIYGPLFWSILFILLLVAKLSIPTISNQFWYYYFIGLLTLLIICIYFVVTLFSPSPTNGIYSIIIILLISSHLIYGNFRPYIANSTLEKFQKTCEQLRTFGNRIICLNSFDLLPVSSEQINLLPPPQEKRTHRLDNFIKQATNEPKLWLRTGANVFIISQNTNFSHQLLNYRDKLKFIAQFNSGISILNYEEPTNRAYVIYSWKSFSEPNKVPELSLNLPHIVENIGNDMLGSSEPLPVNIEDISPTQTVVNIPKTKPGILLIADTYYPGWEATIDGKPAEIVPVNIAFKGIELSEGEHKVVLTYACTLLYTGGILSGLSLLIWLIFAKFTLKSSYK